MEIRFFCGGNPIKHSSLYNNNKKVVVATDFFHFVLICSVLSVRLREGYSIQDVSITKGIIV